jgi:hypothetical protein
MPKPEFGRRILPAAVAAEALAFVASCRAIVPQEPTPTPDSFQIGRISVKTLPPAPEEITTVSLAESQEFEPVFKNTVKNQLGSILQQKFRDKYPDILFPADSKPSVSFVPKYNETSNGQVLVASDRISVGEQVGAGSDGALVLYTSAVYSRAEKKLQSISFNTDLTHPNPYGKQIPELVAALHLQQGEIFPPFERLEPAIRAVFNIPEDFVFKDSDRQFVEKEGVFEYADRRKLIIAVGVFRDISIRIEFPQ